jgi:LPXTG-motif cell wall-anchored protein
VRKKLISKFCLSLSISFLLFSPALNIINGISFSEDNGKVSAATIAAPPITVTAANFQQYFNIKGNNNGTITTNGSLWSTTITNTTGEYAYNPAAPLSVNGVQYGTLTLTSKKQSQVGQATMKENFDPSKSWTLTGQLNLGNTGGADGVGIGWVPDNLGTVGNAGNQLGIGGLTGAFGWTADTYLNDYRTTNVFTQTNNAPVGYLGSQPQLLPLNTIYYGDPNYTSRTNNTWGMGGFGYTTPNFTVSRAHPYVAYNMSGTTTTPSKDIVTLEDGAFHNLTMTYTPDATGNDGTVVVTFGEGTSVRTWSSLYSTLSNLAGNNALGALSFFMTGSTGGYSNLQQFRFQSMTYTPAPSKASLTVNYIDINGTPLATPYNSGFQTIGTTYSSNPIANPANMHYSSVNSSDPATSFNATTHVGTGAYLAGGTVINYTYAPNKVNIQYIDDSTNAILPDTSTLDYYKNPTYTTTSIINSYVSQGYKLVSDNTPTTNLFATDGATYYVHLARNFGTSLKTVTESINYVDNSTKANMTSITPNPYTVSKTFLTINDPVNNTNTYYYQNGNITTAPTLNANGTPSTAGWTKVTQSGGYWIDSSSNQISFSQVSDPTSKGYIIVGTDDPNKTTSSQTQYVTTQLIPTSLTNSTIHVYYDPTKVVSTTYTINRNINYLDGNDHSIVVAKQAQQKATYTTYQVIDTVTGGLLGYDTNGDGIVDSPTVVWLPSSTNSTTNSTTNSPDLTSKGYGQPSQAAVVAFPDVPTLTDSTKITGQPITSSLTDVNVYYNMSGNLIKLPSTGGSGFIWIIVIAIVALLISVGIRIRKK